MGNFFKIFFCLIIVTMSLSANEQLLQPQNEEEALFLRRIVEFNKDQDYVLIQSQIEEYLTKYPEGIFADGLKALLGDLFMQNNEFLSAIKYYDLIQNSDIKAKIALNHLQSLYKIDAYETIIHKFKPYLETENSYNSAEKERARIIYLYADSLYRFGLAQEDPQEKHALLESAAEYFEKLEKYHKKPGISDLDTSKPLAHIYYLLGLKDKGAEIYLKLAEKPSSNKEDLLFQAASIFAEIDKDKAIQIYAQICRIGKRHTQEAALNRMILLFEMKRYPEIILAKQQLSRLLNDHEKPLLHFFLGQSHFMTKDYKRAEKEIQNYLAFDEQNLERKKAALSSLLQIAQTQENLFLIGKTIEKLEQTFPGDLKLYQAYLARALLNKKNGQYQEAEKDFLKLLKQNTWTEQETNFKENSFQTESILFEYAHMLFLDNQFVASRKYFREWIHHFNGQPLTPLVWRYLVHSSIALSEKDPSDMRAKEKLIFDLEEFLSMPSLATEKEIKEYFFLLAKINYEKQDYEESISILEDLIGQDLPQALAHDSHLLLAFNYKEKDSSLEGLHDFCYHVERSLSIGSETSNKGNLHLLLFNAYLKLAEKDKNLFLNAADHLYHAFEMKLSIEKENLLWLANFYYQKSSDNTRYTSRSIHLYEAVLTKKRIEKEAVNLEEDILNLSELYLQENQASKMLPLLEALEIQYTKLTELQWKYPNLVRFYLAKEYEKNGNTEKAIIFYDQVHIYSSNLKDPISAEAALKSAKLRISHLDPEKIQANNPEIHQILKQLKDLIIQKTIANEPLHLQAALEYVELQSSLWPSEQKVKKRRSFLERVKKDFQENESVLGKEYKKNKKRFPEKKRIFDAYMQFIDAQLLSCQLIPEKEEHNKELRDKILASFNKLLKDPNLQGDLKKRIISHMDKLQL